MLRIHFTAADIERTQLVAEPDPLWEVLLSLHMLQVGDGPVPYGAWRQRLRRRLPREVFEPLAMLAPPTGYSPDFLTPAAETGDLGEALELMLTTPRRRIRQELSLLPKRSSSAPWVRQLADGRAETMRRLGVVVNRYHSSALAPVWPSIRAAVAADHQQRLRHQGQGGMPSVLGEIHPQARWRGNVLEIDAFKDDELWLNGRGIRLQPSYFCWRQPTKLMDPDLPPVLVFPISGATGLTRHHPSSRETMKHLTALLGRTRATALARTAMGDVSTTELAAVCNVSLGTASYQAAVLRDAGLIVSRRQGKSMLHTVSELGDALLRGPGTAGESVAKGIDWE